MHHPQPSLTRLLRLALVEPPDPRLTVRPRPGAGGVTELQLVGELDVRTVRLLCEATVTHLKTGQRRLRLDLSGVTWCDDASLYTLLGIRSAVHAAQGHLELTAASETVDRALTRTGVGLQLRPCPGASPGLRTPARPAADDHGRGDPRPRRVLWQGSCGAMPYREPAEPRPRDPPTA
ncbi:STAS domain-containing protein [Streptomyces sp. NPDC018019]|uniref:STAS domain-containing protein n=1 Tax=Streptomyces sp. NPDC018019 TaxID=3365030 RepID=UPI0037ACE1A7